MFHMCFHQLPSVHPLPIPSASCRKYHRAASLSPPRRALSRHQTILQLAACRTWSIYDTHMTWHENMLGGEDEWFRRSPWRRGGGRQEDDGGVLLRGAGRRGLTPAWAGGGAGSANDDIQHEHIACPCVPAGARLRYSGSSLSSRYTALLRIVVATLTARAFLATLRCAAAARARALSSLWAYHLCRCHHTIRTIYRPSALLLPISRLYLFMA